MRLLAALVLLLANFVLQAPTTYMPDYDQVHELVGLPEARGLLIADMVSSALIIITIE